MAWEFLHLVRREFQGNSNWGEMYMKTIAKKWEWLCYTYELPWISGPDGKSIIKLSRIEMGVYGLKTREDGDPRPLGKGWRLQLQNTKHRHDVQIHRAAPNLFIEGCILPVHFNTFSEPTIRKGDHQIRTQSINLMEEIKGRWVNLVASGVAGDPTISIAETLPAEKITDRSHAHA